LDTEIGAQPDTEEIYKTGFGALLETGKGERGALQTKAKAFVETRQGSTWSVELKALVRQDARLTNQMQTEKKERGKSNQMQTEKKEREKSDLISFAARPNAEAQADLPPHGPRNASGIKPCGLRRSEAKEEENMVKTLASPATFPKEIKLVDAAILCSTEIKLVNAAI
jgi:hypothetical protein